MGGSCGDLSPRGYSTSKRANSRQRRWHAEGASVIFLWEAREERDGRWRGTWPVTIAMSLKSTCRTSMIFLFLSFLLLSFTKLCDALGHFGKVELFCGALRSAVYPDGRRTLRHNAHLYSCCWNLCSETQSRICLERRGFCVERADTTSIA